MKLLQFTNLFTYLAFKIIIFLQFQQTYICVPTHGNICYVIAYSNQELVGCCGGGCGTHASLNDAKTQCDSEGGGCGGITLTPGGIYECRSTSTLTAAASNTSYLKSDCCLYWCATCSSTTTCDSCQTSTPSARTLPSCFCTADHYYDDDTVNCAPCVTFGCQTCSNGTACATCRPSPTDTYGEPAQRILGSNCICPDHYWDNNVDQCAPCVSFGCQTCSNGTACATCRPSPTDTYGEPAQRILGSNCICPDHYWDNNVDQCVPCVTFGCQTCSNGTACATCRPSPTDTYGEPAQRILGSNCICPDHYWDNNVDQCAPCVAFGCQTCSNGTACATCRPSPTDTYGEPAQRILGSNCICPDHYFDNNVDQCAPCVTFGCQTCSNGTTCATCRPSPTDTYGEPAQRILGSNCICPDHYWDNNVDQCVPCVTFGCQTCSNGTACATCRPSPTDTYGEPAQRILGSNCICPDHYWDNNVDQCAPCVAFGCQTCSNGTACATCRPSPTDTYGEPAQRILGSNCICPDHYWDNNVDQCAPCVAFGCQTCSNGTACATCRPSPTDTYGEPSQRILGSNCICPDHYWDNNVDQCVPCIVFGCQTCTGNTQCDTCRPSSPARLGNLCVCEEYYFWDDLTNDQCASCIFGCKTCSDGTTCDTCRPSFPARNQPTQCDCPIEYFDDQIHDQCQPCMFVCASCSDGISCDTCKTSATAARTGATCACPVNFYWSDPSIVDCQQCYFFCQTCDNSDTCLTCKSNTTVARIGDYCQCPEGYYSLRVSDGDLECYQIRQRQKCLSLQTDFEYHQENNVTFFNGAFQMNSIFNSYTAREFNGVDNYGDFGVTIIGGAQSSLGFWVKYYSFSSNQGTIFRCQNTGSTDIISINNVGTTQTLQYLVNSNDIQYDIQNLNQWYHIQYVHIHPGDIKLYLNGNIQSRTTSVNEIPAISRSECYMGWSQQAGEVALDGAIDKFTIFNRELTDQEVECIIDKCNIKCLTCSKSSDNCLQCNGNRINPPLCECPPNTYENGLLSCITVQIDQCTDFQGTGQLINIDTPIYSNSVPQFQGPITNKARSFNGIDQEGDILNPTFGNQDITIVFWIKLVSIINNSRIFYFEESTQNEVFEAKILQDQTDYDQYGNIEFYYYKTATGGNQMSDPNNEIDIRTDQWYHFAVTLETNSQMTIFKNSKIIYTNTGTRAMPYLTFSSAFLGSSGSANYLKGFIDDFQLFTSKLTQSEIDCIYDVCPNKCQTCDSNGQCLTCKNNRLYPPNCLCPSGQTDFYGLENCVTTTKSQCLQVVQDYYYSLYNSVVFTSGISIITGIRTNKAYRFQGITNQSSGFWQENIYLGDSDFSFYFWLRFDSGTPYNLNIFKIWLDEGSDDIGCYQRTNNRLRCYIIDTGGTTREVESTQGTGQWHHFIWEYELGVQMRIYKDFALQDTQTLTLDCGEKVRKYSVIGKQTENADIQQEIYFNGRIDEFVIYKRILSNSEKSCFNDQGCHSSCNDCFYDNSNTNCRYCLVSPQYYYHTIDSQCYFTCPDPYYNNIIGINDYSQPGCSLCFTDRCSSCFGPTYQECKVCQSGFELINSSVCTLICKTGCATCQEFPDDPNYCLSCDNSYFLLNNDCVPNCGVGYYGNILLNLCEPCHERCYICISDTVCTKCKPDFYLLNEICYRQCPDGYSEDLVNNECIECNTPCRKCSDITQLSVCTECYQDYFVQSGVCIQCESLPGYKSSPYNSIECIEICGDGKKFELQCDDGNTLDGDGCNYACQIESGYECTGGNSLTFDSCTNIEPIRYNIIPKNETQSLYNYEKNGIYYFEIEFSKSFTLSNGAVLSDLIEITFDNGEAVQYSIKFTQLVGDNINLYQFEVSFEQTLRNREITVGIKNNEQFQATDNGQPVVGKQKKLYVKDYIYYSQEQRDSQNSIQLIVFLLLLILICFIVPFFILNKFHIVSICLDNVQFMYLLGFIDFRQSLNGQLFYEEMKIIKEFFIPNIFDQFSISIVLAGIFGILALCIPILFFMLAYKQQLEYKLDKKKDKFTYQICENFLKLEVPGSVYFFSIFYLRKLMYSIVLLFIDINMHIQIGIFIGFQGLFIIYLLFFKLQGPFKRIQDNLKIFIQEVLMILGLVFQFRMEDSKIDENEEQRYEQSWNYIWIYISLLILHDLYLILEVFISIYLYRQEKINSLKIVNLREVRDDEGNLKSKKVLPDNPMSEENMNNNDIQNSEEIDDKDSQYSKDLHLALQKTIKNYNNNEGKYNNRLSINKDRKMSKQQTQIQGINNNQNIQPFSVNDSENSIISSQESGNVNIKKDNQIQIIDQQNINDEQQYSPKLSQQEIQNYEKIRDEAYIQSQKKQQQGRYGKQVRQNIQKKQKFKIETKEDNIMYRKLKGAALTQQNQKNKDDEDDTKPKFSLFD